MPHSYTGARVSVSKKREIWRLHLDGFSFRMIARRTGVYDKTVAAVCKELQNSSGDQWAAARVEAEFPDPRSRDKCSAEALRALDDFGYFRARYFGRLATPWQEDAADRARRLLESPEKEYAVVNAPPSVGKSTLFTHDIPAWLACRNRRIRCLIGSRTFRQAKWYTARLRRSFERHEVLLPDDDEVAAGRAVVPEASLVMDFGRFRPVTRFTTDVWRAEEFVLAQTDNILVSEKESSFAAYGMDSGFLGGRFRLVIWDDLVDKKNIRNAEALETLIEKYEDEAETRLEPGGLLILQGQRMSANDLYRHALDQRAGDIDDDEDDVPIVDERPAKYHHIVYRAHYEENCRGRETHRRDGPYWRPLPDGSSDPSGGCLLDPRRLTWRELRTIRANREEKFRVLYQQEDVDPAAVLVPKLWVDGGRDPETGEEFVGCWDGDRGLAQVPKLVAPVYSIATADPSPTKFWAVQWWLYHPPTEQRFLVDLIRRSMDAPEFLDWNYQTNTFTGIMEEWQQRSVDLGVPIGTWIVEANAAQRFMLQYDHVRRWQQLHGVSIVPHQTHRNKSDEDFGVQSIAPHYRFGRVRLPGRQDNAGGMGARVAALKLVDEVTRYPDSATDDCVMAHWFLEWNLPRLVPRRSEVKLRSWRPSWSSRGWRDTLTG
jgi:hypothetical protein